MKRQALEAQCLIASDQFRRAKEALLQAILGSSQKLTGIRPATSPELRTEYQKALADFTRERGRELYYPYLSSGIGSGPFVELADGSVKYDMITGIGVNFFGHAHPELMSEMIDGISADIMQGNLQPGVEAKEALHALISNVGEGCRLSTGWLFCSGTMANENALKIIRQKKFPATRIFAFKDCFAGRSTAMQEITDNPKYREGQPVYGEVSYLPFYDPKLGLEKSVANTVTLLKETVARYPDRYAAIMIELVQGEGGFNVAPREFYTSVFDEARKAKLAIWVDEIQTFGRTGELFAYQKLGLNEYVDVVTVGKLLQACATLYTSEYNPRPGLVAGTFAGSTVALRTARKTIEMLKQGGFFGEDGKIERLSARYRQNMERLASGSCKGLISDIRAIGGMLAFQPFSGTMDDVKAFLMKLYDLGVVAFNCGHGPYLVRMLPPFGVMKEEQLDEVCALMEKALLEVAKERGK